MLCVGGTFIVSVVSFYSTYRSFMNSTEGVDRLAIVLMLWSNLFQFMVVVLIAACSTTTREVSHYLHGGILQYICKTSLSNREHTQLCWFIRLSINANILILCRRLLLLNCYFCFSCLPLIKNWYQLIFLAGMFLTTATTS